MKKMPDAEWVLHTLEQIGFAASWVEALSGGSNHIVFAATRNCGEKLIVKFARVRETETKYCQEHCDTLFGGALSLEREAFLLGRIREAGLPTPKVFGIFPSAWGDFIVMEHARGRNLPDYMAAKNHGLPSFLQLISALGRDMALLHRTHYPSFGNIMADDVIEPAKISCFAARYLPIHRRIVKICQDKGGLSEAEARRVDAFFQAGFSARLNSPAMSAAASTLVITDLHGDNFFAEEGKISSYFDVESAQAAPREFELYSLRFFVFNFYGEREFLLAEQAFWQAYTNGSAQAPDAESDRLIDFFAACRLLEIFQSYWGYRDGLRDRWGQRIKDLLFAYMDSGIVDYPALGAIWRERDGQPLHANAE